MPAPLLNRWTALSPYLLSLLRIVAALMFLQAGTMKLFNWPMAMPGGGPPPFLSQVWIGGMLELVPWRSSWPAKWRSPTFSSMRRRGSGPS